MLVLLCIVYTMGHLAPGYGSREITHVKNRFLAKEEPPTSGSCFLASKKDCSIHTIFVLLARITLSRDTPTPLTSMLGFFKSLLLEWGPKHVALAVPGTQFPMQKATKSL